MNGKDNSEIDQSLVGWSQTQNNWFNKMCYKNYHQRNDNKLLTSLLMVRNILFCRNHGTQFPKCHLKLCGVDATYSLFLRNGRYYGVRAKSNC